MTLLQERDQDRQKRRLRLRDETRKRLREALHALLPGQEVVLFGSVVQPGRFNDRPDIDIALDREPDGCSIFGLISELEERMERPVDIVLLEQSRFRDKILREGERWTV